MVSALSLTLPFLILMHYHFLLSCFFLYIGLVLVEDG